MHSVRERVKLPRAVNQPAYHGEAFGVPISVNFDVFPMAQNLLAGSIAH